MRATSTPLSGACLALCVKFEKKAQEPRTVLPGRGEDAGP